MACTTCPFSEREEAVQAQNYGCLPTGGDIVRMKRQSGHNWACHSSKTGNLKICKGLCEHIRDEGLNLDTQSGGLISYEIWYHQGEAEALAAAESTQVTTPC